MKNVLLAVSLVCLALYVNAEEKGAQLIKPKVFVLNPADAQAFRDQGLEVETPAGAPPGPSAALADWPDLNDRKRLLKAVPPLKKFAKQKKWDELELDKFIYRAAQRDAKLEELKQDYPAASESLLKKVMAEAQKKKD